MAELQFPVQNSSSDVEDKLTLSQEKCSICDISPLQAYYRVQHCGHLYCDHCIKNLIASAKVLIFCCVKNCNKELTLEDIRKTLIEDEKIKNSLIDFVAKNEHFVFCPVYDCSYFYDRRKVDKKWTCNLCLNEICIECNVVFHQGFTCEIYQKLKEDPDYSIKLWMEKNQCKCCPKCKTAIEKNGGCNNVECMNCKVHFCWLCEKDFPDSQSVYEHLEVCQKDSD